MRGKHPFPATGCDWVILALTATPEPWKLTLFGRFRRPFVRFVRSGYQSEYLRSCPQTRAQRRKGYACRTGGRYMRSPFYGPLVALRFGFTFVGEQDGPVASGTFWLC